MIAVGSGASLIALWAVMGATDTSVVSGFSGQRGGYGLYRLEAAHSVPKLRFGVLGEFSYATASDFIVDGDSNTTLQQHLGFFAAPLDPLLVYVQLASRQNRNDDVPNDRLEVAGDPTLGAKYTLFANDTFAVAGLGEFFFPTSSRGDGLSPDALTASGQVLASYMASSSIRAHLNVGYLFDNTKELFSRPVTRVEQYAARIGATDRILAGLGADATFDVSGMGAQGFAETTLEYALDGSLDDSPWRVAAGGKLAPWGPGAVEFTLGAEVALSGSPQDTVLVAGELPWKAFGRATFVWSEAQASAGGCSADSDCPGGGTCQDGVCVRVEEKEVIKEVNVQEQTFVVSGRVLSKKGEPISSATVSLGIEGASPLAVDYKTGAYKSFPVKQGEGLIKVTASAPGYADAVQTIPRNGDQSVNFNLERSGSASGIIRGVVKSRAGEAIRGVVFIPTLNKRVRTDKDGNFEIKVPEGRHQVIISAKRYRSQKKRIEVRAGDTVILNVDLSRK